ncbi:MAG: glycosyltransferase family 2 protein [Candidatus Stahlbacteria bacterium]|nr:glycosyltransferase family 2 protein [Candidatus Stahlbacteria bacterium]
MQLSVIIPTCNRAEDLSKTIDSLLNQTILPKEVIIVDNGDSDKTRLLVQNREKEFRAKSIDLKYVYQKEKSAGISRNVGIENSTGDIVLFFDDDVLLDINYIAEILRVYREKSDAVGVQGYITNRRKFWLKNMVNKFFFLVHSETNINSFLSSVQNVYADPLDKIINCEWMVSNNFSFKREILKKFRFDENMLRGSPGEDADLSYRIYKSYPSGLYQTPYAKLTHKGSEKIKNLDTLSILLWQVYQVYLFYKHFNPTLKNKLIFLWSRIGLLKIALATTILRLPESKALRPISLIYSYTFCLRNIKKKKKGDLEFFNERLKG